MRRGSVLTIVVFLCFSLAAVPIFAATGTAKPAPTVVKKVGKVKKVRIASKSYNYIKLSWKLKKNATGYQVYRSAGNQNGFKLVKTITKRNKHTWKNKKLKDNAVYYYKVKAINSAKFSAVVSARTDKATFEESKPTVNVSTYRDGTIISWSRLKDVDGYRVYRAYENGKYTNIKQVKANTTTYFDNTAASGRKCYYKVRGYKGLIFKDFTAYSTRESITTIPRVFLACGHGTDIVGHWDSGCTYKNMSEAGLMLPITKSFVNYMRKSGVYVYTDADANNNKNMIACVREANKHKISAYISVHCDYKKAPTGTLPLYKTAKDKVLATKLNEGVRSQVSIATRGLSKRSDLYELNMPKTTACIFETGSIKHDNLIFRQKYNLYGRGLAMGLCNYLGVPFAG